jgi:hypothetical protein
VHEGAFLGGSLKWFLPASPVRWALLDDVIAAERDRRVDLGRF